MFVFYDTETTGTNVTFDQIVQFSAVLTDEAFQEVDRLDIKCRVLPWIVPAPKALLVTKTSPSALSDPSRPSFFEMMEIIQKRLTSWSPATFIGYNSLRFDETFLHRALWQSLHEPYLTVTNGNSRSDLLPILRAAARERLWRGELAPESRPSFHDAERGTNRRRITRVDFET